MRAQYGAHRPGGRPNDSESGQRAGYLAAVRAGLDAPLMGAGSGDDYPPASYFQMFYDKTAVVLDALGAVVGPDAFHRAFVTYGRRWIGKHPQPYDFFNTIAGATGQDLSWFWRTWFYAAWPLDRALDSVTTSGDSAAITIVDRGLAPMPVLLAVTRADGSVQRLEVPVTAWLGGARRTVVKVAGTPAVTRVELDPDGVFPDLESTGRVWKR